MSKIISHCINKKQIELFIVNLCIVLFLTRTAIPFFKYPFLLIYGILVIYILVIYRDKIFSKSKDLSKYFILFIVLFLYIILSCLFSDKIYLMVIKDILNICILLTLMLIIKVFVCNANDLRIFFNTLLYLFILFALVISVQKIYYFLYVSSFSNYNLHKDEATIDYNFALLPVFFGMIGVLYIISQKKKRFQILIFNILLFIFSITILISGSKRGILLFLLLFFLIFSIQVMGLFVNRLIIKQINKNALLYFFSFSLFIICMIYIIFNTSIYFKNNVLESIGIKDKAFFKMQISHTIFRYGHFIDKSINDDYIYKKVWKTVFDPKDPDAGWGGGNYKSVPFLSGRNVEIVPYGSKGYLLDSTCVGSASPYHAYYFLTIKKDRVELGDSVFASVYCYVSDDFDGNAAIRAEGSITGNRDIFYDLNKSGCWQKLNMPLNCLSGDIFIYLYINKGGVIDFSSLKGYVIFAYPEYKLISNGYINSNTSKQISNLDKTVINEKEATYSILNRNQTLVPSGNLSRGSFLNFPISNLFTKLEIIDDQDPIRNWITKIVSEDTTYHGYKANLVVDLVKNNFGVDRITRWKFAWQIFTKEYNWLQKIFGGGFAFLNWYGYYFDGDKTKSDYPHNPFLHILLYSGILGLLLYILLLYKIFCYYIKYIKEYYLLFVFFLITFFFTFFSGGNPFDPPIMGFFVILPFFIHSIHKKDNLKKI